MRRALANGGRVAVATWRSDDEIPFFRQLRGVAEQRLGNIADQRYSYGDATALEALLRGAGFLNVQCKTISLAIRFDGRTPFLRLNSMALVGMSAVGKQMGDEERRRVVEEIAAESLPVLQQFETGSVFAFELSTNLATARR